MSAGLFAYYLKKGGNVQTLGVEMSCDLCGGTLIRRGATQKYCATCKPQARRLVGGAKEAISNRMRVGIWASLKGTKKGRRWQHLVGYSLADLVRHLERQFESGMTWENIGEWHIDHRIPLALFRYETETDADFKAAWALTNLQPLWAEDNMSKHDERRYLL